MKQEELNNVCRMLEELSEDISVPRNIRRGAKEAKEILLRRDESLDVKIASAISILDELVNDPNTPIHGRTAIWNIMGALESLSAKSK
ncbi:MAG: UPF0147 family protein [Thermoplasmata archaeon]|nr:MAG: UPF0147 family protein [Thermoplasmata archaeon]